MKRKKKNSSQTPKHILELEERNTVRSKIEEAKGAKWTNERKKIKCKDGS